MMMPIELSWHFSQIFHFPILEFYCIIKSTIYISEFMYLQLAIEMINTVEKYGGSIIEPVDNIPIGPNIFFTVLFNSTEDIENFINGMGAERRKNRLIAYSFLFISFMFMNNFSKN